MNKKKLPVALIVSGPAVVLVYLAAALGLIRNVNTIILTLVFAIGPVAIVGVLSISDRLSNDANSTIVQMGKIFLIIAFSFFTLMLVVQQTVFLEFQRFRSEETSQTAVETLKYVFKGVNLVQLGMDVAFDIFYCVGTISLAAAMYRHSDFGRFLGVFGSISAVGLLVLNLWTFPDVPSEKGLVDLGPVTGIWWLMVIVQMVRLRIRDRRKDGIPT